MARIGERIRIAGIAELGATNATIDDKALCRFLKVSQEWYPDATNYQNAQIWKGHIPVLADEVPLISAKGSIYVYINIGHGGSGWSMALGVAKTWRTKFPVICHRLILMA
ncbi:MAG: FAD-dependent oxidoreductase [Glaciimonas sp.]|nr:FAD-dependent oxidoreductase [Glaciimonas sp.]